MTRAEITRQCHDSLGLLLSSMWSEGRKEGIAEAIRSMPEPPGVAFPQAVNHLLCLIGADGLRAVRKEAELWLGTSARAAMDPNTRNMKLITSAVCKAWLQAATEPEAHG